LRPSVVGDVEACLNLEARDRGGGTARWNVADVAERAVDPGANCEARLARDEMKVARSGLGRASD
jgi:hypothetical protein